MWTTLLFNAVHDWKGEQLQATWREIPILGTWQVPVINDWYDQYEICLAISNINCCFMTCLQARKICAPMGRCFIWQTCHAWNPQHLDIILDSGEIFTCTNLFVQANVKSIASRVSNEPALHRCAYLMFFDGIAAQADRSLGQKIASQLNMRPSI